MFEIYEGKQKRLKYTTDMPDGWNVAGGGKKGEMQLG